MQGFRRIQDELYRQYNLILNHKKVLRLIQELGIKSIYNASTRLMLTTTCCQRLAPESACLAEL
ncbi:IS3 family transposase [Paenibacillus luteus]|uniref:IS3 family transposase n=1 Tax=Paenibacillus luteus TaxID=2545753 RepID=UPI001141959F